MSKKAKELPYILFFLNIEELASPFDINMAYDAGFDVVVPYINVTAETARDLVQDAVFSRSREGLKRTCFLIGGKDVQKARAVLEAVRKAMFKPFETSVMIDPNGAYTTASSMVAKVEKYFPKIGLSGFKDCKVVVLGGTGPVGSVTAILCAKLGAETSITSRKKIRAIEIAEKLSIEADKTILGVKADSLDEKFEAIRNADIIFATAIPGIQILPKEVLEKVGGKLRMVTDVNAVPPSGVEGLDPKDNFKKIMPHIFGIGALVIGDLKYKVERALLEDMIKNRNKVYDYEEAFKKAREILSYKKEVILIKP